MVVAARNSSIEMKRKPLAQQSKAAPSTSGSKLSLRPAARPPPKKLEKKEKNGFFGCCKKKKQQNGVKKAAPPKGKLNSLFGGKKKSAPATTKSRLSASVTKPSTQKSNALPPRPFGQAKQQQPSLRPSSTPQVKQQQQQRQSVGVTPAKNAKSKPSKLSMSERVIKKAASATPTKIQIKKSGGTESTQSREREMKTGVEGSVKEMKKPKTFGRPKGEKEKSGKGYRNYEEVKVSVADLGNGFVERKMVLKSIYPQDQPPKPYVASVLYPQKKKSYTCLKQANSFERLLPLAHQLKDSAEATLNNVFASPLVQLPSYLSIHNSNLSGSPITASTPTQSRSRRPFYVDLSPVVKPHAPQDVAQVVDTALQTKCALHEVQQNLRNLNVLTVKKLLPDMSAFNEKMSVVIHEIDHFIDTSSNHHHPASSNPSSNYKW